MSRAASGLNSVMAQLGREFSEANAGFRIELSRPGFFGGFVRGAALSFSIMVMGLAGMVLMLACVNLVDRSGLPSGRADATHRRT
jgi:hypothetical protein